MNRCRAAALVIAGAFALSVGAAEEQSLMAAETALSLNLPEPIRAETPSLSEAMGLLRQRDVIQRRGQRTFVNFGIARVRQDLIDAAPGHDVAAEEQGDQLGEVAPFPSAPAGVCGEGPCGNPGGDPTGNGGGRGSRGLERQIHSKSQPAQWR